jgi:hypothetical protein
MIKEKCICGHPVEAHTPSYSKQKMWKNAHYMKDACYAGFDDHMPCSCFKFKLDNLRLIEDLAKERKLV